VILDVRKALAGFVTISRAGQREFFQVKYEKLPKLCGACGFMGHIHLECGSGEYEEDKLKWGDFLKADWDTSHGRGTGGSRGGGRGGARGYGRENPMSGRGRANFGRGRDTNVSWRHNGLPYVEDFVRGEHELDDTATSPGKNANLEGEEKDYTHTLAKRRLEMDSVDLNDGNLTKDDANNHHVALYLQLIPRLM
jgi:hypothetical protein